MRSRPAQDLGFWSVLPRRRRAGSVVNGTTCHVVVGLKLCGAELSDVIVAELMATDDQRGGELWRRLFVTTALALLGRVTQSMLGVSLNLDRGTLSILVLFESQPAEFEVELMRDLEAELVSHHEYTSDLVLRVVQPDDGITQEAGNWGWFYLRYLG